MPATDGAILAEIVPICLTSTPSLNALATVLLVAGYVQIKRRQEAAHKWTMLACFGVSVVFLACYLTYHFNIPGGSKRFPTLSAALPSATPTTPSC